MNQYLFTVVFRAIVKAKSEELATENLINNIDMIENKTVGIEAVEVECYQEDIAE